jgi:3-oxoacyl-[acyl-carrier protein] reductase
LVNNAGVMRLSPIAQASDSDYDDIVNTNLRGVFNGMREAAKRLPKGGRIINLSSSVVGTYGATYGIYGATKAAVEAMTHIVSKELGPRGINVNVVAPGPVETTVHGRQIRGNRCQDRRHDSLRPYRTAGRNRGCGVFPCRAGHRWITGQVIRVNGGMI